MVVLTIRDHINGVLSKSRNPGMELQPRKYNNFKNDF